MESSQEKLRIDRMAEDAVLLRLSGRWTISQALPVMDEIRQHISSPRARRIVFNTDDLKAWDSSILIFL